MKRAVLLALAAILVLCGVCSAANGWSKFVSADRSISFHYPSGWTVHEEHSAIEIVNAQANEQILILSIPCDPAKTPVELAKDVLAAFQRDNPDLKALNWRQDAGTRDTTVAFEITYSAKGVSYRADVIVIKGEDQVTWFSFSGPVGTYSRERAMAILQGLMGSMATGESSRPPNVEYGQAGGTPLAGSPVSEQVRRDSEGFLFVLEFALGAPFTSQQERLILDALRSGWSALSPEELKKYDAYPQCVGFILAMGQTELEKLRRELEKVIREWLKESPASDVAVRTIRDQLNAKGRVLLAGSPALTEMAAAAYSEIMAYSELLNRDPNALPDDVSPSAVAEIRGQLIRSWGAFSKQERQTISTVPGKWFCLRTLVKRGSVKEQESARADIRNLTARKAGSPAGNSSGTTAGQPMSMAAHWSLQCINQMAFNSYMWSRGFSGYSPAMW